MNRIFLALPLVLALVSCGDKADEAPANDNRGAEGEVLGGTISDAMLPLDTVTSQSPPLRESPAPGAGGASPDAAGEGASDEEGDTAEGAAEPAPEAEPAAEDGA